MTEVDPDVWMCGCYHNRMFHWRRRGECRVRDCACGGFWDPDGPPDHCPDAEDRQDEEQG